jgi:hypothetical protein
MSDQGGSYGGEAGRRSDGKRCGFRLVNFLPTQTLPFHMVNTRCFCPERVLPRLVVAGLLVLGGCKTSNSEMAATAPASAVGSTELSADAAKSAAVDAEIAASRQQVEEANRQLELDRQAVQFMAWQHVKALSSMWSELPAEYFPGLTTLVEQVETLRAEIEQDDTLMIGRIDPEALTTSNPAFWRAVLETNPEDPAVPLFEQMLWASRGYFDHANWLIELHRYGPALPNSVYRIVYSMADEMRRLRARETSRKNQLLDNVPPAEVPRLIATARSFQPGHPDWLLSSIVVRLQQGGVKMDDMEANPGLVTALMTQMQEDWIGVARNQPLIGARLDPNPDVRQAAGALAGQLDALAESRGAFGGRDLNRLSEGLAKTKMFGEALMANRRAVAMRGFSIPTDLDVWWRWMPNLIGDVAAAGLRKAMESGAVRPVSFFQPEVEPEGVSLLPLHPIMAERSLRRLQEVERLLAREDISDEGQASSLISQAETLGHLGRWDEAEAALDKVPEGLQNHTVVMRSWVALWSGRTARLDEFVAQIDDETKRQSPAVPALAHAAQGRWAEGAEAFLVGANTEELDAEFRTYYTLMAAAFRRIAGNDAGADQLVADAAGLGEGRDWVASLAGAMAGQAGAAPGGDKVTEIIEAGRVCEQRFYRAFQRDISAGQQRALLESCVATGVVDFVEYTASLLRLRELDPQRWDPSVAPPPPPPKSENDAEAKDSLIRDANPRWSIPS